MATLGDIVFTGVVLDPTLPNVVTVTPAVVTAVSTSTVVDVDAFGHHAFKLIPIAGLTQRTAAGSPGVGEWTPTPSQ